MSSGGFQNRQSRVKTNPSFQSQSMLLWWRGRGSRPICNHGERRVITTITRLRRFTARTLGLEKHTQLVAALLFVQIPITCSGGWLRFSSPYHTRSACPGCENKSQCSEMLFHLFSPSLNWTVFACQEALAAWCTCLSHHQSCHKVQTGQ